MAKTSAQKMNYKAKPERVQITLQPKEGTPEIELPFVMGVMADLSGANADKLKDIDERDFSNVDGDNFDKFMSRQQPRVTCRVPNKLGDVEGEFLSVDMEFAKMDDFLPDAVARNVPALKKLLELREELDKLKTHASKQKVRKVLDQMLNDDELRNALAGDH